MKCKAARNSIEDYLEGHLAQLDRNEFVTHVTGCPDCESELLAWRQMFRGLRSMDRKAAPARIATAVFARLRADGLVYETQPSTMQRVMNRFFALPARRRYPLAAAVVIASLYGPLAALIGVASGSFDSAISAVSGVYAFAVSTVQGLGFVRDLTESISAYVRAVQTVLAALHQAFGGDARTAVVAFAALAFVISVGAITRRKRVAHHATFGF